MSVVVIARLLPQGATTPLTDAGHDLVLPPDGPVFTSDGLRRAIASVDAIVCPLTSRIDAALFACAPRLRAIGNVAVGYDNVDVAAASAIGIVVCNTPDVLDDTTADLVFALILAASRLTSTAERDLRAGTWAGWDLDQYLGRDVHGATLGLVGYGRIARAVERRAAGFDMEVLHHTRHDTGEPGWVVDLDDLLPRVDVLSLHVPLTPETRHLMDRRRLGLMRPSAVLVNTARGPVLDEVALADALTSGALFGAGLDVYEREPAVALELLAAPRTVLFPHIGSSSLRTRTRMATVACEGVRDVLAGVLPHNAVNPEAFATEAPANRSGP